MERPSIEEFRDVIRTRTGLALEDADDYLIERAISSVVEEEDYDDAADFMREYVREPNGELTDRLVALLVSDETYFFRDRHPFEVLGEEMLPQLLESRGDDPVRIWSAACSTGQEAYSIAFFLRENYPGRLGDDVRLIASDLSSELLEQARAGWYSQLEVNRGLPARMLAKYFRQDGRSFRVIREIRDCIDFRRIDLTTPVEVSSGVDVIFLRYLLTYYTDEARREILDRLHAVMRDPSFLILGGAETWGSIHEGFELLRTDTGRFYRRVPRESS